MAPLLVSAHSTSFASSARQFIHTAARALPDDFRDAMNMVRDFRHQFGRYPHLLHPRTFNEKLLVRKMFDRRPELSLWADKYAVRDYVRRKLGPGALTTIYCVTPNPSEIPFEALPSRFVVKPTHGSGWTYFVRDAAKLNKPELIARCDYWLAVNYYEISKEWPYRNIKPRIMVEEFLDAGNGSSPADYKFFVFAGKVRAIQVDLDRHTQHKRNLYTPEWTRMNCSYVYQPAGSDIPRPAHLQTMIEYAETLADGIDFVRIDLYDVAGRICFGELTNIPESGLGKFAPTSWDNTFGSFWDLPKFWSARRGAAWPLQVVNREAYRAR